MEKRVLNERDRLKYLRPMYFRTKYLSHMDGYMATELIKHAHISYSTAPNETLNCII